MFWKILVLFTLVITLGFGCVNSSSPVRLVPVTEVSSTAPISANIEIPQKVEKDPFLEDYEYFLSKEDFTKNLEAYINLVNIPEDKIKTTMEELNKSDKHKLRFNALLLASMKENPDLKEGIMSLEKMVESSKVELDKVNNDACIAKIPSFKAVVKFGEQFLFTFFSPKDNDCYFVTKTKQKHWSQEGQYNIGMKLFKGSTQQVVNTYEVYYSYSYFEDWKEGNKKADAGRKDFSKRILDLSGLRGELLSGIDFYSFE